MQSGAGPLGPPLFCFRERRRVIGAAAAALAFFLVMGLRTERASAPDRAWTSDGPPGGDVHSLAVDPSTAGRVYLGTASSGLYRSDDGGRSWQRTRPGFPRRDQILESLAVSPTGLLVAGFWDVHGRGGGVGVSSDGGATFAITLDDESVRAVAVAPSDPSRFVAGTLSGVFLSADAGLHWARISPLGHPEIRDVESVAVDPRDARTIYVGTRHLPWKTTTRGLTWSPVHTGMIDDSDVFTITVDPEEPNRVHASACSGLYVSENGAATWSRIQGIPFGSRRTRAFARDPLRPRTLYAGTTEGLWVSETEAPLWRLVTPGDVVVNALAVLPDGSVLAGGDGIGVLVSRDRGRSWESGNAGFSEQSVSSVAFDDDGGILASIRGDRTQGGVFAAPRPGGPWTALAKGLEQRDVRRIARWGNHVLAATDRGLFVLGPGKTRWAQISLPGNARDPYPPVNDMAQLRGTLAIAGTSSGVARSDGHGEIWRPVLAGVGAVSAVVLSPEGGLSLAATASGLYLSRDEGREWRLLEARPGAARIHAMTVLEGGAGLALAATGTGVYRSADGGVTWLRGGWGLPDSDFTGLASESEGLRVFVSDFAGAGVYRSEDGGARWDRVEASGPGTDRVWTLALDPTRRGRLWAAPMAQGLHWIDLQ